MLNTMAGAVVDTPTRCAVFKIDLKGRFVYIDEETEKILGIAPEELFGCSIYDFISADSVRSLENILNRHNRYESFYEAMPLAIRVNDNELNRYDAVVTLNFISGNPVNYQFILVPPQAVEAVSAPSPVSQASIGDELALLSRVGDALGVGVVVVSQQLTVLLKNETLDQISASKEELPDTDFMAVFQKLNLCHRSNSRVAFSQSVFAETIKSSAENSAEYILAESGESLTIIGAPFELADSTVFIFYLLPGRQIDNNEESISSTTGKLLDSFANIVRPPLKTIDGFARLLSQNHSDRLDDDGRFALDCLNENLKILFGMADGLTEISRIRNIKQKPGEINLNDMIAEQIELLRAAYPNTTYQVEISDSLPNLIADHGLVARLFHNLLENAFKYSESVTKPTITIRYSKDNETHRFSISDNGPGIPDNYRRKVFEPFFRIPCEQTNKITGTGLGLAVVHEIVASWRGDVRLERSEGRGSVFSVILPFQFGE